MHVNAPQGRSLTARLLRSSGWVSSGFILSQGLRLGSNLILTRILYPEAFGLMALISVFLVGLMMLSDIGVTPSIQQSPRGDEPEFLDTAWTIQVIRGCVLWALSGLLGVFGAWFYAEPRLMTMLPVAGLALLISGFTPTRVETASRHLLLGRVTALDLLSQVLSLIVLLGLAWWLQSVWSLVIGSVTGALIRLVLLDAGLPGARNRFRMDRSVAGELVRFGKWIFLSTLCGFVLVQGDKAIFGKYLSMEMLGIYNIGYFLAGFPLALAARLTSQLMLPLHRECPPGASAANFARVRKIRFGLTFAVLAMQFTLGLAGVWLIDLLYDDRFAVAGAVVVAVACMNVPHLIGMTYEFAALGRGDSRGVFYLLLVKATLQTLCFVLGMEAWGLTGALAGIWVSQVLVHPLVIRLARRHGAWDPWHDLFFAALSAVLTIALLWLHWPALTELQSVALSR